MRQDYAYIARSTGLCLTTTKKGDFYYGMLPDKTTNPLNELLLLVQGIYVLVKDNSDIDDWVAAIEKVYAEELNAVSPGITRDVIIEALSKGYLGLRVVIWD
ncbi:MAG: hypothetical protein BWX92_01009 [Deltaproteobacteria bacterium ADurb.Bin135]|nr:MAG: hypothetical protein BWX92_01009 [Deltaproteobacteria bacterium ADurb.Bin135]